MNILSDLAGVQPAGRRRGAWRGPVLAAAAFVVLVSGTLAVGFRSAESGPQRELPQSAVPLEAAVPAAPAVAMHEPPPRATEAEGGTQTGPDVAPVAEPAAAPEAARIVDAPPGDAPQPTVGPIAAAAAGSATTTATPPGATAKAKSAARRPAQRPSRKTAPAAPAARGDESDVDIITAIVRHANPER